MDNLLTAIMTKISGSALSTDVAGRIFLDQAPAEAELPYIVFFIVSNAADSNFSDTIDNVLIQFSLFSDSSGAAEITDMYADLIALFDDVSLTVTGYNTVTARRENLVTSVEDDVKHWSIDYTITAVD
jgi:hypothetical protein